MGKLHELLAVEPTVTGSYNAITEETKKVLGKPEMFTRKVTTKKFFDEAKSHLNTEVLSEMATTVPARLEWYSKAVVQFLDVQFQKDATNHEARADLVVDDVVLVKNVPATTLLMLENKLQDVRKVLMEAPTLPAGKRWTPEPNEANVFNADDEVSFSTQKVSKPVVMYEATKEHPAQVKEVQEDVPVARITTKLSQGMLTSRQKADMLGNLDTLIRAAKTARQRANNAEVKPNKLGEAIMGFVFKDL